MDLLFRLLSLLVFNYTSFQNPFLIDFGALHFSPFNYSSRGGSIDLVDSSLIFFVGSDRFYGGFSFRKITEEFDFTVTDPFTLYFGKIKNGVQFLGASLSGLKSSIENYSGVDLTSKSEKSFFYPSLFYSKRLNSDNVVFFRVGFPYYSDVLVTPSDTFNSRTKYSLNLSLAYFKQVSFQWQYFFSLYYFVRSHREVYSTIQSLLNYDSTKTYSRFNATYYTVYTPFQNTYLFLGPLFEYDNESYSLSALFAGQYEALSNLFLYFEYLYGYHTRTQRTGNFESRFYDTTVNGPFLGVRYRKDFIFFVFDYSLGDKRFRSISVKFDLLR